MKDQSRIVVLLVIVLSLLNVWLLYTNQVRQDRIENLVEVQNQLSRPSGESANWGFEQAGNEAAKIVHPEVELPEEGLSEVV